MPKPLVAGLAFYATARFGLHFGAPTTLVWAPAGIALAAFLRWGPAALAATTPAHFAANLAEGLPASFAAVAATAGAVEVVAAAWLLGRLRIDRSFGSIRDALGFAAVAAIASPALGALVGTAGLVATGLVALGDWSEPFARWWVGDGVGVLVVAPLLLLVDRIPQVIEEGSSAAEAALLTGALLVITVAAFSPWPPFGPAHYPIAFIVLPVVAWIGYRLGPPGAALANFLVAFIGLWGTLGGTGSFVRESRSESAYLTWAFLSVTSLASLALAALVSARDRAERALREAYEALQAIETATQAGTWIWRPHARLHIGSQRQRQIHGVGDRQDPVPPETLMQTIHPEDRERIRRAFAEAWRERGRIEADYRVVLPDGDVRWVEARAVCVPVDPTRPAGPFQMVGVHVDVSERREMEAMVRRSERLVSLGTFAAGVAHELNNPLGTILLAVDAARQGAHDPGVVARALDDISEDAERAARIVKSVLRFAREETTERAPLDLDACLDDALDHARPYCRDRGVALEARIAKRPLRVLANATEIGQVVQNLVRNSAEACEPGGRVWVEADAVGDEVVVIVSDDGCGMTATEVERAFDPFYTTRAQQGGSGLGLSICHGIVEAHGGRIEIDSLPGTGTRVWIRLPSAERGARTATGAADGAPARG